MIRTPEPELMDEDEGARAYATADFSEPNARFVATFLARFPHATGLVADLGCGPADISLRLAKAAPGLTVHAIDGSAAMLATAKEAVAAAGLDGRVTLYQRFLPADLPAPTYDAIISNSLLHHLPDPAALWRTIASTARPGAAVLVMDLFRPESAEDAQRIVHTYAADEPPVLRRDFLASLHAAFTLDEVAAQLAAAGLGHLRLEQASDRHLIVSGHR